MDISASRLPVQAISTPHHVGESQAPKINHSHTQPLADPVVNVSSDPVISSQNPTYSRPIAASNTPSDHIDETNHAGEEHDIQDEPSNDSQPTTIAGADEAENEQKNNDEIYSEAELKLISDLKTRDAEVVAHERAHAAVGGQHAGSPSYSYKTGPDGVKYAVSGEVSIDTSRVPGDPQATLQKAQQIKAAALAPAEPSGQDRKVAAKADQMAVQARNDILASNTEGEGNSNSTTYNETTVPEHFTQQENLDVEENEENHSLSAMSARNSHIHALYQNSAHVTPSSTLDITI